MSARARIHAMLPLDETAAKELDARLDALVSEELRAAAADLDDRVRAGGPRARGLVHARNLLIARANGTTPAAPRRNVVHRDVAEALRAKPGEWALVGDYINSGSAAGIARLIRDGGTGRSIIAYQPAGAFEARVEPTLDGVRVFARYVGGGDAR
jgi:hypothetical protein